MRDLTYAASAVRFRLQGRILRSRKDPLLPPLAGTRMGFVAMRSFTHLDEKQAGAHETATRYHYYLIQEEGQERTYLAIPEAGATWFTGLSIGDRVIFELVAADVQRDCRPSRRALRLGPNQEAACSSSAAREPEDSRTGGSALDQEPEEGSFNIFIMVPHHLMKPENGKLEGRVHRNMWSVRVWPGMTLGVFRKLCRQHAGLSKLLPEVRLKAGNRYLEGSNHCCLVTTFELCPEQTVVAVCPPAGGMLASHRATDVTEEAMDTATMKDEEAAPLIRELLRYMAAPAALPVTMSGGSRERSESFRLSCAADHEIMEWSRSNRWTITEWLRYAPEATELEASLRYWLWPEEGVDEREWSTENRPPGRFVPTDIMRRYYLLPERANQFRRLFRSLLQPGFSAVSDHMPDREKGKLVALAEYGGSWLTRAVMGERVGDDWLGMSELYRNRVPLIMRHEVHEVINVDARALRPADLQDWEEKVGGLIPLCREGGDESVQGLRVRLCDSGVVGSPPEVNSGGTRIRKAGAGTIIVPATWPDKPSVPLSGVETRVGERAAQGAGEPSADIMVEVMGHDFPLPGLEPSLGTLKRAALEGPMSLELSVRPERGADPFKGGEPCVATRGGFRGTGRMDGG